MAPRKQKNFQAFLKDDEWERFLVVVDRAKERHGRTDIKLSQSYVVRRLAGIDEPNDVVTAEDVAYFLNKQSSAQIVPQLSSASTDISDQDTQPDSKQNTKLAGNGG